MIISGRIDSELLLELKFPISGKIDKLVVSVGDVVKKGQLLASLDQTEFQTYLDRALKQYEKTRAEFEEKQKTNLTQYDKTQIQADLDISVKNVEIAKQNLESTNMYSPDNGTIIQLDPAMKGVNITPNGFKITFVNPETLKFIAQVNEQDLNKIVIGSEHVLKLTQGFQITCIASSIGMISLKEGLFPVIFSIKDNKNLRIRMTGNIEI